jgi:hypothetical protein
MKGLGGFFVKSVETNIKVEEARRYQAVTLKSLEKRL